MPNYRVSGRVVGSDGAPVADASVSVHEILALTGEPPQKGSTAQSDAKGRFAVEWAESNPVPSPWDLFVRASKDGLTVESALISDLESSVTVDLVLSTAPYAGRSEWERVAAKLAPHLGGTAPKDVPVERVEWLARRAEVFPLHLAAYVQAHRLSEGRTIEAQSCYAFLRGGLPNDLSGLVRAGAQAWESALRDGWSRRWIPQPGDGSIAARDQEVADELAAMRELIVDAAVARPTGEGVNQRAVLDTAGLSEAQQRTFTTLWLDHGGSTAAFWTAVEGSELAAEAPQLKFTVEAATRLGARTSTLAALQAERDAGALSEVADTAAWSPSQWASMLETRGVTSPAELPGGDEPTRRQHYARALHHALEDAYPSASFVAALQRDEQANDAPPYTAFVATFLLQNPSFDLAKSTLGTYLSDANAPWAGVDPADQDQAKRNLELVARVYRLSPPIARYATTKVLLVQGVSSAAQVVASTRSEFVSKIAPQLPDEDHEPEALAGAVWDNAAKVHALTLGLSSQLALAKTQADFVPVAIPGAEQFADAEHGLGQLSSILGNLDFCACTHCRSVFSPAAYLADLLSFLKARPAEHAESALEVLLARRPDLAHILLDCANTNTALPYIDLVNELLEDFIAGGLSASSKQTTWTSEELRLHPEHLDASVYAGPELTQRAYPWTLPFSLPALEARTYLRHLGVPRHELMRRVVSTSPAADELDARAAEQLGLDLVGFRIVAGSWDGTSFEDGREYWGFSAAGETSAWVNVLNGTADPDGDVGELLRRGRFELDELRELLGLGYVDPSGDVAMQWSQTCALADATIAFLDAPVLDRLHRFARLQRATQIPASMLDLLVREVLGGVLDGASLRVLADVVALQGRLRLPWDELASFWAAVLDTREDSLYARRFLAKSLGSEDPAFVVDNDGVTLVGESDPPVAIHVAQLPRVLAGLGLGDADYQRLAGSSLASDAFSLSNLTALFRSVTLARALRLSVEELVRLVELTGLDAFADPAATAAFVDEVSAQRESGVSLDELDWLLRHGSVEPPLLDEAAAAQTLTSLAEQLLAVEDEVATLEDPDGQALTRNLVAVLDEAEVATTLDIVTQTTSLTQAQRDSFLDQHFAAVLDVSEAKQVLADFESEPDLASRRAWLLRRVVGHLRRRALVLDTVARAFGVPVAVAEALATTVLTHPNADAPLLEVYRQPFATREELAAGLSVSTHPSVFAAWTRLAKATLVCARFELRADEVSWYSGRFGWLDLDALPLSVEDPAASYTGWARLRDALALRSLSRPGQNVFAEVAEVGTLAEATELLAAHTGWDAADTFTLLTSLGFTDADTPALAQEVLPARLQLLVDTAARLGVSLDVLRDWAAPIPSFEQAAAIKAATRAKYGEARWPEVAKPLRDAVRQHQRDALVDAAMAITPAFRTTHDVFEHLLTDVEMSPCMMTSRVKQAIASVQIFVHRALLHLEIEELSFDPEAIQRWEWMKTYRVWEANRKVFLYPENWIEPQLRPDKTPEFEALEANMLQGVLDTRRIETSLAAYLESLVRVANLELIGVHEHPDTGELWLLGRTHARPHAYFVRRRTAAGLWEGWDEVPGNIEGDAAVLFGDRGRLQLFWATREEAPRADEQLEYRFRVHHQERGPDGWSAAVTSRAGRRIQLPEHEFRLHFVHVERVVYLSVLWQHPDVAGGRPGVADTFRFDLVERFARQRDSWIGEPEVQLAEVEDINGVLTDVELLSGKNYVALAQAEDFEGQRNVQQPVYDADAAKKNPYATRFVQDEVNVELFDRASEGRQPAFVHQADIWTPHQDATMRPAIYDDRLRKYLIEPTYAFSAQEADPGQIGHFDPLKLVLCPVAPPAIPDAPKPKHGLRKRRDGLLEAKPFALGVPGVQPQLQLIGAPDTPQAPAFMSPLLLSQSKAVMQGAVEPEYDQPNYPAAPQGLGLKLLALYHPFARDLQEALASEGLDGLYAPPAGHPLFRQQATHNPFGAEQMGLNLAAVHGELPVETFDFDFDQPYATYNWELFFFAPLLIADKLATEQRFDEAQRWYHRIFNPVQLVAGEDGPSRFWRLKPFVEQAASLTKDQFEVMLGIGVSEAEQSAALDAFARQVAAWESNPFDPHAVARVRPGVYQRALLRKYFDNLLAWADHLFRKDTIESITEATVLYIVLAELLGPRPREVPGPQDSAEAKSFAQLDAEGLDAFGNTMVELESWIHLPTQPLQKQGCGPKAPNAPWVRVPVVSHFWYFCYPPNPELMKYWDLVADRLFKIRHCQTIDGVTRQLPLFEAPIDPGLLVRARAAGLDLSAVLTQLDAGLPPYRFRSVHARATAFAASLRSLGASLLSALEKRDAEALSRLRAEQELEMLARVGEVRREQVAEAEAAIASLEAAREVVRHRFSYYYDLARTPYSDEEMLQFDAGHKAQKSRSTAQGLQTGASVMSAFPQISVFPPNSAFGGIQLANVMSAVAAGFTYKAAEHDYEANHAGLSAGYKRRNNDWAFQVGQAERERERVERDLAAAEIRLALAKRELDNHGLAVEQSEAVDAYLRGKFSNRELYDWMTRQLADLYLRAYQLAFDLAKRAERAYRHELAIDPDEAPIIRYGYWDDLRKGLLAGERLGHDLERLDVAYMDRDRREFELRKSVSLAQLDPAQLHTLRETGRCTFEVPEVLFDLDHPGHYLRRLRAVRVTIPAVVGPHTSLGATLQLLAHKTRRDPATGGYAEDPAGADPRFVYGTGAGQAIATSSAVADGGLFNLDFRDERYLPFEYAGAISSWTLELPGKVRQFDYRTIADVVVHLDYTARPGGDGLRQEAEDSLVARFNEIQGEGEPLSLALAVAEAFPAAWQRFLQADEGVHTLELPLAAEHFPHFARDAGFAITQANVALLLAPSLASTNVPSINASLDVAASPQDLLQAPGDAFMTAGFAPVAPAQPAAWTLTIDASAIPPELATEGALDPAKLAGLALILRYTLDTQP